MLCDYRVREGKKNGDDLMKAIELFIGAGGLAMGTSIAGFDHAAAIEYNHSACETIRANQKRGLKYVQNWPLIEEDVHLIDFSVFEDNIELIAGGPPCQPFSVGGQHKGFNDKRNMFPEAIRAVREIRPKAFIFENVKGLIRQSFSKYFEYILLQLSYPELALENNQTWENHLGKLERYHTQGKEHGLKYNIVFQLLNAADFGVPQKRERVFIVGFRSDLGIDWSFPKSTHSKEALLWSQFQSDEYWERHRVPKKARPRKSIVQLKLPGLSPSSHLPWRTIRDAFEGLPDPCDPLAENISNHNFQPGARKYKGHMGSPIDEPAKTLKAGDHGVPGGENMVALPDGSVRYFTVRESARLQTFPDEYLFNGCWTESMRQIGNAVPVKLAEIVAKSIYERLRKVSQNAKETTENTSGRRNC